MTAGTSLNTATKAMLEVCARRGVSIDELLKTAEINPALFDKFNVRIPVDKKRILWEAAHQRLGDEHIGLRAAEIVPFGGYGVLDFLLFASSTLGDALRGISRFYKLLNASVELRLEEHKNFVLIEFHNPNSTSRHMFGLSAEYAFAMLLIRFGQAAHREFEPEKVCFTHFQPVDTSLHRKSFRSPILFGVNVNRLVLSRDSLNAPLSQSDPELAETLEYHAERLLKRLPTAENDTSGQVREILRARICGGDLSLKATAKALAMSERNLQRRLYGQATSYRELLDRLRHELALDYIAQQVDASEITRRLGFSETGTYYRAFQRWSKTYSRDF